MSKVTTWQGGKRLQTQVLDIAADTTAIRCLDWDRDRFDIEFACAHQQAFPRLFFTLQLSPLSARRRRQPAAVTTEKAKAWWPLQVAGRSLGPDS
jgi:hypothetical protein